MRTRRARLEAAAAELDLPGNPLDMIIHELGGPKHVAESKSVSVVVYMWLRLPRLVQSLSHATNIAPRPTVTGRKGRFVSVGGRLEYQARNYYDANCSNADINIREKHLFNKGKKLVAIISEAGAFWLALVLLA